MSLRAQRSNPAFCSRRNDVASWAVLPRGKAGLLRRFAPRNDGAVTLRRRCERSEAILLSLGRAQPGDCRPRPTIIVWRPNPAAAAVREDRAFVPAILLLARSRPEARI